MNRPLVSVVIPVFNVEELLPRCIESVLGQSYTNLDIILVNDGSTDNSLEICNKYASLHGQIRVISKKNGGLASARNAGISLARGIYICFIDSDDWIHKDYVKTLLHAITKYNVSFSCCRLRYTFSELKEKPCDSKDIHILNAEEFFTYSCMENSVNVSACNKLYRLEYFNDISYPEGKLYEDVYPHYLLTKKATDIACVDDYLYNVWLSSNSITRSAVKQHDRDLIDQWQNVYADINTSFPNAASAVFYRICLSYLTLVNKACKTKGYSAYKNQIFKEARIFFKQSSSQIKHSKDFSKLRRYQINAFVLSLSFYRLFYCAARNMKKMLNHL